MSFWGDGATETSAITTLPTDCSGRRLRSFRTGGQIPQTGLQESKATRLRLV